MKTSTSRSPFCLASKLDRQSKKKRRRENPVVRDRHRGGNDESCRHLPNRIRKSIVRQCVDILLIDWQMIKIESEFKSRVKFVLLPEKNRTREKEER